MARTSNPKRKPWPSTKNVGEFEFPALPGVSTASKRARQSAADLAALRESGSASTAQGQIGIKEAERRAFRDKVTEGAARSPGKPERTTFKSARREDDSIAGLAEVTTSRARTMREADQKQARVEKNLARLRSGGQGRSDMVRRAAPPSGLAPYSKGAAPGPYALGQAPAEGGAAPTPTDPRVAQLAALRKAQKGRENSPFLKGTVSDRRFEANRAKIADIEGAQLAESRAATQRQQGIDEQRTALDEASKRRIGEAEAIAGFTAGREEASDTRRATRETQAQEAKAAESRFLASQKLASVEQQNDYINKSQENAAVFQNASNMLSNLGNTIADEEDKEGDADTVRLKELKEQQSLIRDGLLSRMKEQGFVVKERADKSGLDPYSEGAAPGPYALGQAPAVAAAATPEPAEASPAPSTGLSTEPRVRGTGPGRGQEQVDADRAALVGSGNAEARRVLDTDKSGGPLSQKEIGAAKRELQAIQAALARGHWKGRQIEAKGEVEKRMEARVRQIKQGLADLEGQA